MDNSRWAAGSMDDMPIIAWESENTLWLLPGERAVVIDTTRRFSPESNESVDGMVSHLLESGLYLAGAGVDVQAMVMLSRWTIEISHDHALTIREPSGVETLITNGGQMDEWVGMVRARAGVLLYSGTGLFTDDGLDLEAPQARGALVMGWAALLD